MSKITIELYDSKYATDLEEMLVDFSQEVYGAGIADIDKFVDGHWFIYLAIKDGEPIGFSSYIYNTYFGLRPPTIGNSYLYVKPPYRKGRAAYLLTKQTGYVSIDTNLPLELYYASNESRLIGERTLGLEGSELYSVHEYPLEHTKQSYNFYKK